MKNPRWATITARINLCILSILLLDTFVFKPVTVLESFRETYSTTAGTSTYARGRYYLVGAGDQTYKVPESVYIEMNHERSQYLIFKSFLFKRPLKISYTFENNTRQENLNILNNSYFGLVVTLFIFIVSLLNITSRPFLQKENFNQKAIPFCSILLFWILNFYFSW